jgi:short-subunit dehydrogenase
MTAPSTPRAVVITGASAGLGVSFAEQYATTHEALVLVARRRERLEELATRLRADHGVEVKVVSVDLMEPGSCEAVLAAVDEAGWATDILVNNAGFGANGDFHELALDRNLGQIRLNIEALTHLCGLFLPRMVAAGRGRILNVASTAAFQPGPGMAVYCATKSYVLSFSEAIAQELAGTGVTVTAYCPGPVHTEFAKIARNDATMLFRANVAGPDEVVRDAIDATSAGKVVAVHGWVNTATSTIVRFLPKSAVRRIAAKVLERTEP